MPSYRSEILPLYKDSNWYIGQHTLDMTDLIFHSTSNRNRAYYKEAIAKLPLSRKKYIRQNMAQAAIRIVRYYRDHPQQFGHNPENIYGYLLVVAWKIFVKAAKSCCPPDGYMAVNKGLVSKYGELYYDCMVNEIENPSVRPSKLKKRKLSYGKHIEYLCTLG